jgi:hypothetical protein
MRARYAVIAALVLALAASPGARVAHAAGEPVAESRFGVVLMATCGLALKLTMLAPVPWSGVAVVSCLTGLLDAALTSDGAP